MKKAAALFIVLAIAVAGMPALLGSLTQGRIAAMAEAASAGQIFQVSVSGYERNWRTSRATLNISLHDGYRALLENILSRDPDPAAVPSELGNLLDRQLDLTVDVTHGPLLSQGGVGIGFADTVIRVDPATEGLDELLATLGMPYLVEAHARIGIASISPYRWTIPPVAYTGPNVSVTASGLNQEGTYRVASQRLTALSHMDSLEITAEGAAFSAESLTYSANFNGKAGAIWTGVADLSIRHISAENPGGQTAGTVENLEAHVQSEASGTGDRVHFNHEVNVDSLHGTINGEDHDVTGLQADFAVKNIDVPALTAYQEMAIELAGAGESAADPMTFFDELQPILYRFAAAEPELEFGPISFEWNGGMLNARFLVRIDNEMLPAEPLFAPLDSGLWSRLLAVEAELDVDQNVAEWIAIQTMAAAAPPGPTDFVHTDAYKAIAQAQARGTLVSLAAQGMLEETETGYRFRGAYENGMVEVNGTPLPFGPSAQDIF